MQRKEDWESLARKQGYGKYNFNVAGKTNQLEEGNPKKTVPRGVLYCCVPLCHSYKGKIVDGKKVQLHRLPKDTKAKRLWIAKLHNVPKKFFSKAWNAVCSFHFEGRNGPKPWCQFPTLFPSKPKLESPVQKGPLPDRTRGEAALHSTVSRGINSEVNSEDSLEIKKKQLEAEQTTSLTVSMTIFAPNLVKLTLKICLGMDQEIQVFSFVPVLLTAKFKLKLK